MFVIDSPVSDEAIRPDAILSNRLVQSRIFQTRIRTDRDDYSECGWNRGPVHRQGSLLESGFVRGTN